LANSHAIEVPSNLKRLATGIAEQGNQHRWRVEVEITQEIDRAIDAYKRNRLDIFDCSIILDYLKSTLGVLSTSDADRLINRGDRIDLRQSSGNAAHSTFNGNGIGMSYSGHVYIPPRVV
jgi:hypothetical protein